MFKYLSKRESGFMHEKVIKSNAPFSPKETGYREEKFDALNNYFHGQDWSKK